MSFIRTRRINHPSLASTGHPSSNYTQNTFHPKSCSVPAAAACFAYTHYYYVLHSYYYYHAVFQYHTTTRAVQTLFKHQEQITPSQERNILGTYVLSRLPKYFQHYLLSTTVNYLRIGIYLRMYIINYHKTMCRYLKKNI